MAQTAAQRDTILVIDDDHETLEFLQLFLSISGYAVRTAASGQAGLAQATDGPLAAVLLDRRLPDLDGVAVCQALRDRLGPEVPIMLLTADHDRVLDAAARAAGATAVLWKPFDPPVLLDRLTNLLPS